MKTLETLGAKNINIGMTKWRKAEPEESLGYSIDARLVPEAKGYSVYIPKLSGVVSQGENVESAIKNIMEAFAAAIETYRQEDMPIPWTTPELPQPGEQDFRIAVHV